MKQSRKRRTCRQILASHGVKVVDVVPGEFVAYKPTLACRTGEVDVGFELAGLLCSLEFCEFEEVALGRAFYVMGNVDDVA